MPGLRRRVERASWWDSGIDEKRELAAAKRAKPMTVVRGRKGSEAFIVCVGLGQKPCGANCELHQMPRVETIAHQFRENTSSWGVFSNRIKHGERA